MTLTLRPLTLTLTLTVTSTLAATKKLQRAEALGVRIISEEQFIAMLGDAGAGADAGAE